MTTGRTGPIAVVVVRHESAIRWFRGPRVCWVLDLNTWRDEIVAAGNDVPPFTQDFRFGIHCVDETSAAEFLRHMGTYEVPRDQLSLEIARRYPTAQSWWDVADLFPIMFVDFDNRTVASFYPDGIPMERYAPHGWESDFVDFANDYPEAIFPTAEKFWVKGDSDLLELLNQRTTSGPTRHGS